ncbi:MAG TPA: DNA-directed RNA polymerase subunit omega [Verrucomicrobiae bacterium]|nr:DNA-directed RNA polymerase subunit omega [Verrucomicrobiae bacterium]
MKIFGLTLPDCAPVLKFTTHTMKAELVTSARSLVPNPDILVNMVSRRVRQLGLGYRPLVPVDPTMTFMDVALKEISEKKLVFEEIVDEEDGNPARRKTARRKRG